MEKILKVTLTPSGAEPSEPLCGGTRGEHRATALILTPDDELSEAILRAEESDGDVSVKFDVVTEAGEFIPGEEREVSAISEPFYLTAPMTASGLDAVVLVRFIVKDAEGRLLRELYKAQIRLWFEDSFGGIALPRVKKTPEAEIEAKAEELCLIIEQKAAAADQLISLKAEQVSAQARSSAEQLKKALAASEKAEKSATEAEESAVSSEDHAAECRTLSKQMSEGLSWTTRAAEKAVASANEAELIYAGCKSTAEELTAYADGVAERLGESANSFKGKAVGRELLLTDVSPLAHRVKLCADTDLLKDVKVKDTDFGWAKSAVFYLEKGKTYRYAVVYADGAEKDAIITGDGWDANSSPAYIFSESNGEFVHGYSSGEYAMYFSMAAEKVLSAELAERDAVSAGATITVTDKNGAQTVVKTDDFGQAVVDSAYPEMRITCSQNLLITAEYNRDTAAVMGELETALDGILQIQKTLTGGGV